MNGDERVLAMLDRLQSQLHEVKTGVAVINTDLKHHRRDFGEARREIEGLKGDVRQLQDDRKISKGMKILGVAIVTVLGAVGGTIAGWLHK